MIGYLRRGRRVRAVIARTVLVLVCSLGMSLTAQSAAPVVPGPDGTGETSPPRRWSWAALMHRAFAVDVLACVHCGGRLRLIATLHDPAVIRTILAHLGRASPEQSPRLAPSASGAAAP